MATSHEQIQARQERQGMSPAEIAAMVQTQIQQGQAQIKLQELYQDNFDLRGKNKDLTSRAEAAEVKVPKDGELVLSGDDVLLFNEAKATGKSAKQLKELVKEHGDLSAEVVRLKRKTLVNEIAEAEGWKPSVLERLSIGMDLAGVEEVQEEVDDPDKEGEKRKVQVKHGFINVKDAAGNVSKKRLTEELAEFISSLSKAETDGDKSREAEQGTPLPRMARGDKAADKGTKSASTNLIAGRYKRPSKKQDD